MIHVAYPNASTYVLTVWEKKPLHCTPYLPYIKKEYMLQSIQPQKNHENHVGLLCIWQSYLFAEKLVQKLATRLVWFHGDCTQGNAPVKCMGYMIYSSIIEFRCIFVDNMYNYKYDIIRKFMIIELFTWIIPSLVSLLKCQF